MDRDVENPMVVDSLWDEIDEIEREQMEEAFYKRADEEYDERCGSWFEWSRENDGYHF